MVAGEAKRAGATSMILSPGLRYLGLIELMKASYGSVSEKLCVTFFAVKLMSLGGVRYFWANE
jgi:hypothetical protein